MSGQRLRPRIDEQRARQAEGGDRLVDRSHDFDHRVRLGHAPAEQQAGRAVVAGLGRQGHRLRGRPSLVTSQDRSGARRRARAGARARRPRCARRPGARPARAGPPRRRHKAGCAGDEHVGAGGPTPRSDTTAGSTSGTWPSGGRPSSRVSVRTKRSAGGALPAGELAGVDHVGLGAGREHEGERRAPALQRARPRAAPAPGANPAPAARYRAGAVARGSSMNVPNGSETVTSSPTARASCAQPLVVPPGTRATSSDSRPSSRGAFASEYERGGSAPAASPSCTYCPGRKRGRRRAAAATGGGCRRRGLGRGDLKTDLTHDDHRRHGVPTRPRSSL